MPPLVSPQFSLVVSLLLTLIEGPVPHVEARLHDGSTRVGAPHVSTNESCLRLRCGDSRGYVIYGIDWSRIAEIRTGQKTWHAGEVAEFRAWLAAVPAMSASASEPASSGRDLSVPLRRPIRPVQVQTDTPQAQSVRAARVRSIDARVASANWDEGVERDGLVLRVWPRNEFGEVVEVSGTLDVTLIGDLGHTPTSGKHDDSIQRIAHWVEPIGPSAYGWDGADVRLPFQNFHPERARAPWHPDHQIAPYGEVHVRMTVPGHGVFRASTDFPVRLRRTSSLRDRYFIRHGTRFVPAEE